MLPNGLFFANREGNSASDYFEQICNLFDPYTIDDPNLWTGNIANDIRMWEKWEYQ